jgi:SAM-dependent methyltransferase
VSSGPAEDTLSEKLEFTGERFTPECVREIWYEHFHRYVFAREMVRGKRVLDAACGEGYGSALLAAAASSVQGVDISEQAVAHARSRYQAQNLKFRASDCLDLPYDDDEFDCIVSFETLEHLEDQAGLLSEFRRVLKADGFLLLSSPDKAVYTDRQQNRNEYHVRELYRNELEILLGQHFPAYRLWGQKLLFQSAVWSLDGQEGVQLSQEKDGEVSTFATPAHDPVYFIAICAAEAACLPDVPYGLSLFDDAAESVYEHYYQEIRRTIAAGTLLAERDREIAELKSALAESQSSLPWWRRLFSGS